MPSHRPHRHRHGRRLRSHRLQHHRRHRDRRRRHAARAVPDRHRLRAGPAFRRHSRARRVRPRDVWDATDAVSEAFRIVAGGRPTGRLPDRRRAREPAVWVRQHARCPGPAPRPYRRPPRPRDAHSRTRPGRHRGQGPRARPRTDRARNFGDRRDAFEKMRDTAAGAYRAETGKAWRPRHGTHVSQTGHLTSAAIDARDFVRARGDRETRAHLPEGTLVAVAGGKDVADPQPSSTGSTRPAPSTPT